MGRTFYNIKSLGTVVDNGYPNNKLIQACFVGIKLNIVKNIFNLYMYFIKTDIKFIGIYKVYTKKTRLKKCENTGNGIDRRLVKWIILHTLSGATACMESNGHK